MLWKIRNLAEEIARKDVEIARLEISVGQFNFHNAYRSVMDLNYGFASYSSKQNTTNVLTDNTKYNFSQPS